MEDSSGFSAMAVHHQELCSLTTASPSDPNTRNMQSSLALQLGEGSPVGLEWKSDLVK